jgi:hypothetical protein
MIEYVVTEKSIMDLGHLFVSCVVVTLVLGATFAPTAIFIEKYLSYEQRFCFGIMSASGICGIVLMPPFVLFEGRVAGFLALLYGLAVWICIGIAAAAARLRRTRPSN